MVKSGTCLDEVSCAAKNLKFLDPGGKVKPQFMYVEVLGGHHCKDYNICDNSTD